MYIFNITWPGGKELDNSEPYSLPVSPKGRKEKWLRNVSEYQNLVIQNH